MKKSHPGRIFFLLMAAVLCVSVGWFLSNQHRQNRDRWAQEAQRASEALTSLQDIASRVAESERGRFGYAAGEGNELLEEARSALKLARAERDRLSPRLSASAVERQRLELLTGLLDDALSLHLPGELGAPAPSMKAVTLVTLKAQPPSKTGPPAKKITPTPTPARTPVRTTPIPLPKVRQLGDLARVVLRDLAEDEIQARQMAVRLETEESRLQGVSAAAGTILGIFFILLGAFTSRSESANLLRDRDEKAMTAQDSVEILNRVDDGLAVFDPESGSITGINDRFLELTGYPRGQLLTGGSSPLFPADLSAPSGDAIRLIQKAGREGSSEGWMRVRHRTGSEKFVRASFRRGQVSGFLRVVGVFQDVGELQSKHREAASELERMRGLFGPAAAPALLLDPESGRVVEATEAAGIMFGCSPEAIVEGRPEPLAPGAEPYTREKLLSHFEKTINHGPQTFDWSASDGRGRRTDFQVNLQHIVLAEQDFLLAVLRDLHWEKQQRDKVLELEELLEAAHVREKVLKREAADREMREEKSREENRMASAEQTERAVKLQAEIMSLKDAARKSDEERAALNAKLKEESHQLTQEAREGLDKARMESKNEREERERLERALAAVPGVLFTVDSEGIYRLLEGRDLLKLGLAPGELVGKKAGETGRGLPRSMDALKKALGGDAQSIQEEVSGITWKIQLSPQRDAENKVTGCVGIAFDVTESDRTQRSSRERMDSLISLLEAAPEAFLLADAEGHITFAGGGALAGLGLSPWDAMGKSIEEITPEPGDWHEAREKAVKTGSSSVSWRTGSDESFKGLLAALKDASGQLIGYGGMLWSSQRESSASSPDNWPSVIEASGAALMSLAPDGTVVKANAAACRLLTRTAAECVGKKISDLSTESWRDSWAALLERALKEPVEDEPINLSRGDGGEIELLATLSPLPAVEGKYPGTTLFLRDLSAKTREELATRNYLMRLEQSQLEILQATGPAVGRLLEDVDKIRTHAMGLKDRAGWAINPEGLSHLDNLQEAAVDAGMRLERWFEYQMAVSRDLHCTALDLSQALKDVAAEMKELFDRSGAQLEVGDLPVLEADADLLRLLFSHLLGNALHHPVPGRPLVVRIHGAVIRAPERSVSPGWCQLEVEDNGQGLPEEETERLFLPPTAEVLHTRPGAGLGLLICRRVVERHGGTISAKSVHGEGSTLIVVLPLIQRKA